MKMMADGDVPLVASFGGSEIEFGGANGTKTVPGKTNSRSVFLNDKMTSADKDCTEPKSFLLRVYY